MLFGRLRKRTHRDVGRAARRPRHDQGHRARGELLRLRDAAEYHERCREQPSCHVALPWPDVFRYTRGRYQDAQSAGASQRRRPVAYWLLKTEPEEFSWDDQVKRGAKGEAWTGVRNFTARG